MEKVLDPRSKIILVLFSAIYVAVDFHLVLEGLLILICVLPFFISGLPFYGLTFLVIYVIQLLGSLYILPHIDSPFLIYIVSFLFNGFRLLLPGIITGTYAIKTTTVSEWIAAFKKWRFPNFLLIPIAVMLRFFPSIKEDYQHIRKAMAFRGIGSSATDLIKQPAATLEYILIPLLMNATQVAEDLTVSALTKGLSLPGKHTSIVILKWTTLDWIFMVLIFVPLLLHKGGFFL